MENASPLRLKAAIAVPAILIALNNVAYAQNTVPLRDPLQSPTCGWPSHEADPLPAILRMIEDRLGDDGYVAETARDGLADLRRWIHECNHVASRLAVQELRRAYDRSPSDPVLEAALGVALARGIDVQQPGAEGHNFRPAAVLSNAERDARRLLVQVLEEWPVPQLAVEFAALALATRDRSTLDAAAAALEDLCDVASDVPSLWTARAEIALARREYDEAREAAGRGARLGDPSAFRALGVTRLLRDDDPGEGGRMYLEGLASADEAALYRFHEDLAPLLLFEEEREWTTLASGDRKTWLREAWEWRASTSGRTVAERLAVHFERLETAIHRYRRLAHYGARPAEAIVWDSLQLRLPFDDRGLILIRHGEPDDIVRAPSGRMGPGKEAWLYYGLANGRAVFEFRKVKDWADYVLATPAECDPFIFMYGVGGSLGEARFLRGEPARFGWDAEFERATLDYGTSLGSVDQAAAMNAARCFIIVRTGKLQDELPYIRLNEATRRMDARHAVAEVLATETATPRFENFIQALASIYTFRGDDERSTVAAFLLLPAGQLTPRTLDRGVAYPLRLSLAVEDNLAQRVQRLDTLITFGAAAQLPETAQMRTALQMPVEPVTEGTVRITVANADHPDEGQILVGAKPVPLYRTGALSMSDLVVGEPGPGSWRRGSVSISPLPGHQLPAESAFELFYEVYGLEPNETIRTRLTVAPGADPDLLSRLKALFGTERVLEMSFEESAQPGPDGVLQVERTITPSLEPGRYTLEVTIKRPERGDAVTMRTSILLLEESSGG